MTISRRQAQEALEEIAFDHATGRLTDADYADLRRKYEAALAASTPAVAPIVAPAVSDAVAPDIDRAAEALVQQMREASLACPECGPRPEPEAAFCSNCGRFLGVCPACGSASSEAEARFCSACGAPLPA